jgi:Domain of unknown function (DUF4440)
MKQSMRQMITGALALGVIFAAVVAVLDSARVAATETRPASVAAAALPAVPRPVDVTARRNSPAVLAADRAFLAAVAGKDSAALGRLLDPEFTWTNARGETFMRTQVLRSLPATAIPAGSSAAVTEYTYGQVGVVEANRGRMHVLRIWVDRSAGWRQLDYQEVESLAHPPTFTPGTGTDCVNPCTSLPVTPKNPAEAGALRGYMALETAAVGHNAEGWDHATADEFFAASSNSDKPIDKPSRLAGLRSNKMGGLAPTPMVSARLFDFPGVVVMISLHKPAGPGDRLRITRVFIEKQDRWVATISYQTSIAPRKTAARRSRT